MKLISDIKQYLILNDFPSVNEAIAANSKMFLGLQTSADCRYTLLELKDVYMMEIMDKEMNESTTFDTFHFALDDQG